MFGIWAHSKFFMGFHLVVFLPRIGKALFHVVETIILSSDICFNKEEYLNINLRRNRAKLVAKTTTGLPFE